MKRLKNESMVILIAAILAISMISSIALVSAHNSATDKSIWQIPTYAYIVAAPSPIGVGQTATIYMWLDAVYGAAGGSTAAVGTNGYTASAALLSNNYRFNNYKLTITAPDNTVTSQTFAVITDTTSSQYTLFTPTQTGTYTLNFTYPGQVYGANGNGYSGSILINDTYLPSTASTTIIVQTAPIPAAITSEPLPTNYWAHPTYGENTNWYAISSNWLGTGSVPPPLPGQLGGYSASGYGWSLYQSDAIGPLSSHIMWTQPIQMGGVVGGNRFTNGGASGGGTGVAYFDGTSYQSRYTNPIIVDGYLYFTEPVAFTDPSGGATVCENLQTGQVVWSSTAIPSLSFAYIYNLWDPDQHGTFPPILFTAGFARAFDAFTGLPMFNVTGVPSGTTVAGPSGEQLKYVFANAGSTANPQWYLSEWNSSKLWQYDINPYTGGGSLSPSIVNASNGLLVSTIPVPIAGATGTLPPGAPSGTSNIVPYGSTLVVNADIPISSNALAPGSTTTAIKNVNQGSLATYDWNISVSWRNTMTLTPSIVAAEYDNLLLCRNGSLPGGFAATGAGTSQGPYTYFAVDVNPSHSAFGQILWMQTYNPPAGNLTVNAQAVDFQTGVFCLSHQETMQFLGYSLTNGNLLWTTPSQTTWDYYGIPGTSVLPSTIAYGNLYCSSFGGICYCYNDLTGAINWTYGNGDEGNSTYGGFNVFYGVYPTQISAIANGVVYLATNEHTITDPLYKGCMQTAINATTGQQIYQLSDYPGNAAGVSGPIGLADGYATFFNSYDNQIYVIGQGPSFTTVTAPKTTVTVGSNIVIEGTVMDISAGTKQTVQAADFPNGVPCASDASMTQWMGYVYQQQAEPTDFAGVTVTLSVLDSNGNQYNIGTVKTDESGSYSLAWAPSISGNFTIYATFAGTNGYWPSSAETHIYAGSPPATAAPTTTPVSGLASNNTLMYGIVAIIVVIIVGIAALATIMLRKRP